VTLNKEEVSKEKFFKIDILSSRGLAVIHDLQKIYDSPVHDPLVYEMLCQGDNIGVTLAESPLMRKTLLKFQPKSIEDLAMCLSVIRPAAKDARNLEVEDLDEEEIQQLLSQKIIYDDDAIHYISSLLGCSEDDADKFRRVFAKGDKKGIEEFRQLVQDEEPIRVLKRLSAYGFCKAHAFSYAQLVYDLAYYKLHAPKDFWRSVLKHSQSSYKHWVHIYEARLHGVNKTVKDVSIYAENRRKKIQNLPTPLDQMRKYGYWVMKTEDFFPGSYFYQMTDEVYGFSGLIASLKKVRNKWIIYLGVERKIFIEVIIENLDFVHSKWIGCKGTATQVSAQQKVYQATKYTFF
jgi:DNA polymerase III alpha subunit